MRLLSKTNLETMLGGAVAVSRGSGSAELKRLESYLPKPEKAPASQKDSLKDLLPIM